MYFGYLREITRIGHATATECYRNVNIRLTVPERLGKNASFANRVLFQTSYKRVRCARYKLAYSSNERNGT